MAKPMKNALDDFTIRRLIAKGDAVADGDGLIFTPSKSCIASWAVRYRLYDRRPGTPLETIQTSR